MAFDAFRHIEVKGQGRLQELVGIQRCLSCPAACLPSACGDFAALAYTVPLRVLISVNAEEEERLALYLMMWSVRGEQDTACAASYHFISRYKRR